MKLALVCGHHLQEQLAGRLYAKAQNYAPRLAAAYDAVLQQVDVLLMPTAIHYAHLVRPDSPISEHVRRGYSMAQNTAVFDATGHPAISIPAAEADGLPVGVMLVAPHREDARLLSIARTYELHHGWLPHRRPAVAPGADLDPARRHH
jgi:amidase